MFGPPSWSLEPSPPRDYRLARMSSSQLTASDVYMNAMFATYDSQTAESFHHSFINTL